MADVCGGYPDPIKEAMDNLLHTGFIRNGGVTVCSSYVYEISVNGIQQRILDIENILLDKEIESTVAVLNGQAVDGEDYVSKPGCVRETEPEKYDPLNMVIVYGRAYCLDGTPKKRDNGSYRSPCDLCDLREQCRNDQQQFDPDGCHSLCRQHYAASNQYYREVGVCAYYPSFGTIEVIDEHKQM